MGMNSAYIECRPGGGVVVMSKAKPPITGTGEPILVSLFVNWTIPAAAEGDTLATRITGRPWNGTERGMTSSLVVVARAP